MVDLVVKPIELEALVAAVKRHAGPSAPIQVPSHQTNRQGSMQG
jgi:DNA-binding response OmpR family regulator